MHATEAELRLARRAASTAGAPAPTKATLQLHREGTNRVLIDRIAQLVFRVSPVASLEAVKANLGLVAALHSAGAPCVPPLTATPEHDDALVLTVWPLAAAVQTEPFESVAAALRAFHETKISNLKPVDLTSRIQKRSAAVPAGLPGGVLKSLEEHTAGAIAVARNLQLTGSVLVHGDAHPGNVVAWRGAPALIDLDDVGSGPPEVDLAPALTSYRRFHRNAEVWDRFRRTYGGQSDWDLVRELALIRETTMNLWLASRWHTSDAARAELLHRVTTWDIPPADHAPWTAQ